MRWLLFFFLTVAVLSCSHNDDPAPPSEESNLVEATATGAWAAEQLKLFVQLSGRDFNTELLAYDVDIYRVVYETTYQGNEINASGLVLLPKTTGNALPMISFHRGTIVKQSDAPSTLTKEHEQVISYAGRASMGFITAVPDMIGFGESKDVFHPYYVEEPAATAVIDLHRAAHALAREKNVEFDKRVFLAGYSQGGYITLAAHKALEANPVEDFELVASFPAAGGYDVLAMHDHILTEDTYPHPYYLAYVVMGYRSFYDEDDLVSVVFNEPYASRIPGLFDGNNSAEDINAQLTTDTQTLVREDVLLGTNTDPLYDYLQEKLEENSLTDWAPKAPVFFYHGSADVTVPIGNTQGTYDELISQDTNAANLHLITLDGTHSSALEGYIEDLVKKLEQMK
ncbi:MAG TPA: prolyl oligopeptidase family serine peptidase [Gammaproteobacteria bacterium]